MPEARTFRLDEARMLMPEVRRVTREAVTAVEQVQERITAQDTMTPEGMARADQEMRGAVEAWASTIEALGAVAKGLWLVDFDNGAGYYCWQHPEPELGHYHDYDAGFGGRTPIQ